MGDVQISGRSGDKATLLLAAAEKLDLDPGVVRTTSRGYSVPEDVAKEAGFDEDGNRAESKAAKKAPAKKAPAKKAPAKKAAAKKAPAKKAAAKAADSKPQGEE